MKLDNYFKIYKKELDNDAPDKEKMWQHIAQAVDTKKRRHHLSYMRIAATVLILVGISLTLTYELPLLNEKRSALAICSKSAFTKEQEYKKIIKKKQKEILPNLPKQDVQIINFLKKEYQYYENEYAEAINQLQYNKCNSLIINIVYKTYERRIAILNDMKYESEKFKNYASNNQ